MTPLDGYRASVVNVVALSCWALRDVLRTWSLFRRLNVRRPTFCYESVDRTHRLYARFEVRAALCCARVAAGEREYSSHGS